jgi:hypothetical protein
MPHHGHPPTRTHGAEFCVSLTACRYGAQLFRDDEAAAAVNDGEDLIEWQSGVLIDRFDVRWVVSLFALLSRAVDAVRSSQSQPHARPIHTPSHAQYLHTAITMAAITQLHRSHRSLHAYTCPLATHQHVLMDILVPPQRTNMHSL